MRAWIAATSALLLLASTTARAAESATDAPPPPVQRLLKTYCLSCHDATKSKGHVRLDALGELDAKVRLDVMNKVQEQLHFSEMPPEGEKQPESTEQKMLVDWVRGELQRMNAPLIEDKLRYPDYGNAVDHDRLFSGEIRDKAYSPARRWLVSPQIFKERVIDVFGLPPRERNAYAQTSRELHGVTNPFILPDRSGVRDYAITPLDGGHLLMMLGNAQWIAGKQIRTARVKHGEIRADEFDNKADRFSPPTPAAFEAIILGKGKPTDDALAAAIRTQFSLVLRRTPTDQELAKYLELGRSAIDLAGNTEGLRQVLVAVLLESEFLYRMEFGAGEPDAHGRRLLAPQEAAFAISYALGDRGPDPLLLKAAAEGRLQSRDDYRREVLRLLADRDYYRGPIDTNINDSQLVSHPKIIRFFRDFFGYPNALKVFKDKNRSGGYYDNPGRGSSATPGHLVREADRLVELHVDQDQRVFENLLTTDRYFMYHNISNEQGAKVIADWTELYNALKDTDWRKNPEKVAAEHSELLARHKVDIKAAGRGVHSSNLARVMQFLSETIGRGNTPFTTYPWVHGYKFRYAQSYNFPATPGVNGVYEKNSTFNYPVVQPFQIENRMGILTHPAWLIAHSSNFHTDPIRRGRWIQEKLLAGRVPDVPITVDAKVPEHPNLTFRERVESVTGPAAQACWKCHQAMNPLGYAFERYDDFGRYRTEEPLENPENLIAPAKGKYDADTYKTRTVNSQGELRGTGDPSLDGPVTDALDLIGRLAKSTRARQSIIRHAFRFYMGRNETLADSQTLIDADKAYVDSGGSFKAVIVSLLTSDSFIYRK
jgi:hypothetical protein